MLDLSDHQQPAPTCRLDSRDAAAAIHGQLDVAVVDDRGPRLAQLYQKQPLRALFPRSRDLLSAVIVNTAGGVVGGDRHDISVDCGAGAHMTVTGQAAEKIYRSTGATARIDVSLTVGAHGWLEWLPQGTILFDRCRLRRSTTIHADADARIMAGEILALGRTAMGEDVARGLIQDNWRIHRADKLVWADALRLDGDIAAQRAARAGFDGARSLATFLFVAPDAAALCASTRALLADTTPAEIRCGATALQNIIIARWLGADSAAVRRAFGQFWAHFRAAAAGLPARLPTIWTV